jgi:hypothetical protein
VIDREAARCFFKSSRPFDRLCGTHPADRGAYR